MISMKRAENSIKKHSKIANSCVYRPKIHFLPPAGWINDPNGTIYHNGYYHLFYQTNPFGTYWNHIHWGHAKSKDLVHWEHLPLALAPQKENGEHYCFSGCLVINQGVPMILYTSIKNLFQVRTGGETWGAIGDDNLIEWKRLPLNPVMSLTIHGKLQVHHWRDPYVWKSGNIWYAVMGGQLQKPKRGAVFLYKSHDLQNWKYLHPLAIGNSNTGKAWECPNFFNLGKKWMLIISPFGKVIYTLGTFENLHFNHSEWRIFDHSRNFYATNTLIDEQNRLILFGWIRGDKRWKQKKWQGCISLPKILSLDSNGELQISFVPQLEKLRDTHLNIQSLILKDQKIELENENYGQSIEIKIKFKLKDAQKFGIYFFEEKNGSHSPSIQYNSHKKQLTVGKEKANCNLKSKMDTLNLHIFIDRSVIEVIINHSSCITSRIYPKLENSSGISLFAEKGTVLIETCDIWDLKPI
ncbi:MAG: glycoside hydrolase family 32 protein [Promethearchaeota archaeon]